MNLRNTNDNAAKSIFIACLASNQTSDSSEALDQHIVLKCEGYRYNKTTWLIRSSNPPEQVRDDLERHINHHDGLLVFKLNQQCASYGMSEEFVEWFMLR